MRETLTLRLNPDVIKAAKRKAQSAATVIAGIKLEMGFIIKGFGSCRWLAGDGSVRTRRVEWEHSCQGIRIRSKSALSG